MSGQDDTMRLAAEVVDKWSGPLREMNKAFRQVRDTIKGTHSDSTKAVKENEKAYRELHQTISRVRNNVAGSLTPALTEVGITAISVGGSIAAVVSAVKDLGDTSRTLTYLNRQSEISVTQLRAIDEMAERIGVSAPTMNAGLARFGDFMAANARNAPQALAVWNQMPGSFQAIGQSLKGLSRGEQLNKVLEFTAHSRAPIDQKRKLLAMMGLPEDLANASSELLAEYRRGMQHVLDHPIDVAKGLRSKAAFEELRAAIRGLKDDLGGEFAPGLTEMIKELNTFLGKKETIAFISAEFKSVVQSIREIVDGVRKIKNGESPVSITAVPGGRADQLGKFLKEPFDPMSPLKRWWHGSMNSEYPAGGKLQPLTMEGVQKRLYGDDKKDIKQGTKEGVFDALMQWWSYMHTSSAGGSGAGGGANVIKASYSPGGGGGLAAGGGSRSSPSAGGMNVPDLGPVNAGKKRVMADTAQAWAAAGMGHAGIAGIMGNIEAESGYNPNLRHPDQPHFSGEAHYAHGLYQEGGAEWNRFSHWLNEKHPGGNWRDHKLQNEFLIWNLQKNYPKTWDRLKRARSPGEAAIIFGREYEKPAHLNTGPRMSGADRAARMLPGLLESGGMHGEALRRHFGVGRHEGQKHDLLTLGQRAGLVGGGTAMEGSASLKIDLNGFPRGTRTQSDHSGLFKEVRLNRGRPMASASEEA